MARKYGYPRKYSRTKDPFIDILFKVGKSMISSYKRESRKRQREQAKREAAYERHLYKGEQERIRQIKQHEMALRRTEREWAKENREKEKETQRDAKLIKQFSFENEIENIEDDNFFWTRVHSHIKHIVSLEEVNEAIAQCDYEQQNNVPDGFFTTSFPSDTIARQKALEEADTKYDTNQAHKEYVEAENELNNLSFDEIEPTIETVTKELEIEAKERISSFFPWKQSKLRKAYITDNVDMRFKQKHNLWQSKKDEYELTKKKLSIRYEEKKKIVDEMLQTKNDFVKKLSQELYDEEVKAWENERETFYFNFRQNLQEVIDGEKDYVISAIGSLFPDDDIPQEYFVDFAYIEDKGKIMVDLDLPEIEDLPNRKIVLTPTGKKSIRIKGQSELKSDYANCVFGLAMYVAYLIFNVSIKIEEIEICGFTQRKISNSTVAMDQYLFVVNFSRELFSKIDFSLLSSLQILDFFKHHFEMTKGFDLKQIDLGTAFCKMESFIPIDYNNFYATLSIEKDLQMESPIQGSATIYDDSVLVRHDNDSPAVTFDKATKLINNLYDYLGLLLFNSIDYYHTDNLNNVSVNYTNGNFNYVDAPATYRGKLFIYTIIDLYRSLVQMRINVDSLSPSTYPLALFAIKIYEHKAIQYPMLNSYESFYHSFIDVFKSIEKIIPVPNHFYLVNELFPDSINDKWQHYYQIIMKNHIALVRDTVQNSLFRVKYVDNFQNMLLRLFPEKSKKNYAFDEDIFKKLKKQLHDPLFEQVAELVVATGLASISMIRRHFSISYNRAEDLIIQLETYGIVGPALRNNERKVLIADEKDLHTIISSLERDE